MINGAGALALLAGSVLTNNFVFSRFFAERTALGDRKLAASALVGSVVALILAVASVVNSALYFYVLAPLNLAYLGTVVSMLVIMASFTFFSRVLRIKNPMDMEKLAALPALIGFVSVVLGAVLLSAQAENFLYGALTGIFGGAGFLLAVVLLAGVRERIAFSDVPEGLKGLPIGLVTLGLIALAFLGFSGFGS